MKSIQELIWKMEKIQNSILLFLNIENINEENQLLILYINFIIILNVKKHLNDL